MEDNVILISCTRLLMKPADFDQQKKINGL